MPKSINRKKYLILYILKILEANTDADNVMTQAEIARWISQVLPCDRKTVGRNVQALTEMGYPIVKSKNGIYLDKKTFSVEERTFVLNAVAAYGGMEEDRKEELIERLSGLMNKLSR